MEKERKRTVYICILRCVSAVSEVEDTFEEKLCWGGIKNVNKKNSASIEIEFEKEVALLVF